MQAATIYYATLSGSQENPAVSTTATGYIMVTVNGDFLSVNETFSGLTGGTATGAHIHCCTAVPGNTAVAIPFTGYPSAASGSYVQTFDLTLTATYTSSFLNGQGGGTAAGAEAVLLAGLASGQAYANIHDAINPGGEIRGNLLASPEPTTSMLMLAGLIPAIAAFRRRVRK